MIAEAKVTLLEKAELPTALAHLLAPAGAGHLAQPRQVRAFERHMLATGATCLAWAIGQGRVWTGVCAAALLPGRTALLLCGRPGEHDLTPADCLRAGQAAMRHLESLGLHYVQALCEPDAITLSALLARLELPKLTRLLYLERDPRYPWLPPPAPHEAAWEPFSDSNADRFAALVHETYRDSLDCPELNGLRPIADVLAAHRAAGRFDPQLWQLARVNERDCGVLLLATLPEGRIAEVSYMGVHAEARRRGVARILLRRAFELCSLAKIHRVTLVVDERNEPARALYSAMGFRQLTQRDAYCCMPRGSARASTAIGRANIM